jgi:hypothetical protein
VTGQATTAGQGDASSQPGPGRRSRQPAVSHRAGRKEQAASSQPGPAAVYDPDHTIAGGLEIITGEMLPVDLVKKKQ